MKKGASIWVEGIGTAALLCVVVGSGVMGETLAQGNQALALMLNACATGAALFVLIDLCRDVSGAHFNPCVTLLELGLRKVSGPNAAARILSQCGGAVLGVWVAHLMFGLPVIQASGHARDAASLVFSEFVATCGLLLVVLHSASRSTAQVATRVALTIFAAYLFTSSTSFANPAATLARSLTNTFAGIHPQSVLGFVAAQLVAVAMILVFIKISGFKKR